MAKERDKSRIIANTREMLAMAEAGLTDAISPDPKRRRPGLMNLSIYGRGVTSTIQTMKNTDPAFEEWWTPYQERMKADPLMRFFKETRNEILKEGELTTQASVAIGTHGPVDMGTVINELSRKAPPNVVGTFISDEIGGSGWDVRMPDGSTERIYGEIPDGMDIEVGVGLPNPPAEHEGKAITDTTIENLGRLYLAKLSTIVDDFEFRFRE